jgi:RNA polymerase sigma factor (sigma-70 family)
MGLALRVNQPPPSSTEHQLVAAVRRGDDSAFEELFSRYRSRISAYVMTAVGDHGRAEDITQDVFIAALRRLRDTERPISFKPWIYAIAKNACIDEFRRTWRASEVSLEQNGDVGPLEEQLPSSQPSPEAVLENRQQLDDLQGAFRGLSENHHRILVLRELEGLSYGEIGKRMGMSRAMVESTLFRARKRLNAEFKDLESGRRCEHVRSTIDRSSLRSLRMLGIRERRQVERHLSHCHACRKHAWLSGFDASSLKRRGVAEKVAAFLPFGWWPLRRAASSHGPAGGARVHSLAAARLVPRLARYSDPATQAPLGRAAAAAAALALAAAGGGYAVAGSSPEHHAEAAPGVSLTASPSAAASTPLPRPVHTVVRQSTPARSTGASRHGHSGGRDGGSSAARTGHASKAGGAASKTTHPGAARPASTTVPSSTSGSGSSSATSKGPSSAGGRSILNSVLGGALSKPGVPHLSGSRSGQIPAPTVQLPASHLPSSPVNLPGAAQSAAQAANQALNAVGQKASQVVDGTTGALPGLGH